MRRRNAGPSLLKVLPAAALGAIGYSALFVPKQMDLPDAVNGEHRSFSGRAGGLSYYVAGQGAPLLLIHSVNAAGSAFEVKPLFEHYAATRRVYALELPGFARSERSARDYTPRLMTDAILDMLAEIKRDGQTEAPDALALSLASEFLARAAFEAPDGFRSVALISPTGFGAGYPRYDAPGSTREVPAMEAILRVPLWRRALFDGLTSKASIRFFYAKTFGRQDIPEAMIEYAYRATHQPDAENVPYAFVSGKLFSSDISRIYESLELPVWMAHGTRGDFTDYSQARTVAGKPNWHIHVFETGALPHWEVLPQFVAEYDAFLHGVNRRTAEPQNHRTAEPQNRSAVVR